MRCNTCKQFCVLFVQKLGASGVAVGEVCGFDGVELAMLACALYLYLADSACDTCVNDADLCWSAVGGQLCL